MLGLGVRRVGRLFTFPFSCRREGGGCGVDVLVAELWGGGGTRTKESSNPPKNETDVLEVSMSSIDIVGVVVVVVVIVVVVGKAESEGYVRTSSFGVGGGLEGKEGGKEGGTVDGAD